MKYFCTALCRKRASIVSVFDGECMIAGGLITGDIRVNGYPKVQATFARICG